MRYFNEFTKPAFQLITVNLLIKVGFCNTYNGEVSVHNKIHASTTTASEVNFTVT